MKVEKNVFYVLDLGTEKWVFSTEADAVAKLKTTQVKDPETVKILEVDVSNEKWAIKQVSWARIAMKLLSSGTA